MRNKLLIAVSAAGIAVAGVALQTGIATAGHTNVLLEATLDGRSEVGAAKSISGDPNGTGEAYVFGIDDDVTTLCYVLTVDKIGELSMAPQAGTRMAHIHEGVKGKNGPVVATLAWPQGGQAADCLTDGEKGKFAAGTTAAEILAEPGDYYVNVHNAEYPTGAIRGQLAPQQ